MQLSHENTQILNHGHMLAWPFFITAQHQHYKKKHLHL